MAAMGKNFSAIEKNQIAERMAKKAHYLKKHKGHCTRTDLIFEGFNENQIDACWPLAAALISVIEQSERTNRHE